MSTQHARAKYIATCIYNHYYVLFYRFILEHGQINHNHSLGVFTVVGTTGNPYAVRLFPTESCSCPSTNRCYHLLAVRMSIGLDSKQSKQINLTQLRRNTRSRKDKKSGRKAPRHGDYEINPAPDSKITMIKVI